MPGACLKKMTDYAASEPDRLLEEARGAGDVGRLFDLYRSYLKTLARIQMGGRLAGKLDASDVVQEVFLRASTRFEQFQGTTEQEFLAWLRKVLATVLSNLVRQYHGTQQRDPRLERELDHGLDHTSRILRRTLAAAEPSPSEHVARKELAVLFADALEQLPDHYREVILLRHIEELPFPEIAARMNRSVDSVKKLWPRALARLRQLTRGIE
jgi:RNA polymerase sigma-70 factor (ECF subfamily)